MRVPLRAAVTACWMWRKRQWRRRVRLRLRTARSRRVLRGSARIRWPESALQTTIAVPLPRYLGTEPAGPISGAGSYFLAIGSKLG